jgi:hypothetical protein
MGSQAAMSISVPCTNERPAGAAPGAGSDDHTSHDLRSVYIEVKESAGFDSLAKLRQGKARSAH